MTTSTYGNPLTPMQQKLSAANIARLQYQRAFGIEKPKRRDVSLIDLAGYVPAKNVAAIPLQRVL